MLHHHDETWLVEGRFGAATHRLEETGDGLVYTSPALRVRIDTETFEPTEVSCEPVPGEPSISLRPAAEMFVLARGILATHPFLPNPGSWGRALGVGPRQAAEPETDMPS
jgi:hypothetical protein